MQHLWLNSPLPEEERRASILRGDIHLRAASPATVALCDAVGAMLEESLPGGDPRRAELPGGEFYDRVSALRARLARSAPIFERLAAVVIEAGCDPKETYLDALRLRAIQSDGHLNPAAAPAYFPHSIFFNRSTASRIRGTSTVSAILK